MSKYEVTTLTFRELDHRVTLPKFQRRLVWSEPQKKAFIETLRNGYPFGSILIYKYPQKNIAEDQYSLIDGLQRFTTIQDYYNNPIDYIRLDDLVDDLYEKLEIKQSRSSQLEIKRQLEDVLIEFTQAIIKEKVTDKVQGLYDILQSEKYSIKELSSILQKDSMSFYREYVFPNLEPIVQTLEEKLSHSKQINDLVIPTVIFTGDETELADVFHNLNRGGKKLSKYQVFAAQWSRNELRLPEGPYSEKLLSINIDRYKTLDETREVEIKGFDPLSMSKNRVLNFAEICYAIGVLIVEELSVFISPSSNLLKNEDLANELGYSTVAATFGVSNRKLHELIQYYSVFEAEETFIEDYVSKVIEVYQDVNNEFKRYLKIPGKDERYASGGHTNFMLLSYFSTLWHIKYEIDTENSKVDTKSRYSNDYNKAKGNFILYYLNDQASSYWSGTGDSKLDNITVEKNYRYLFPLDFYQLENNLLVWNDERSSQSNIMFDNLSKTIVTIIASLDREIDYKEDRYDFEHVIARSILRDVYKENKIPAGSLGNIMILDSRKNRLKKEISL